MSASKPYPHLRKIIIGAGIVFLLVQLLVLLVKAHSFTGQWLAYPLDDTYIHLAVAKNMADSGVWGLTSYEPTFCLSSPAYTFLLSMTMWVFGPQAWLTFGLNLLACLGIIWQASGFFVSKTNPTKDAICLFVCLLLVVSLTPLASLALSGMEHTFHLFLVLVFFAGATKQLDGSAKDLGSWLWLVCLPLLMLCRYESVFVILPFLGILFLQKKYKKVLIFGFMAFVPMGIYGIVSLMNGWFLWPSSVLLKNKLAEHRSDLQMVLSSSIKNLWNYSPSLIGFLILFGYIAWQFRKQKNGVFYMALLLLIAGISQVFLAQVGWYRYECWLMGAGSVLLVWFLSTLAQEYNHSNKLGFGLNILLCLGVCACAVPQTYRYLTHYPRAATNIFEQQVQMGKFIDLFYRGGSVALNDIGAACWLSDFRLLDIYGLATKQVTDLNLADNLDSTTLKGLFAARQTELIIAYPIWFKNEKKIPAYRVASWQIRSNLICGSDIIWFYVPDISQKSLLMGRLKQFESQLPKQVLVQYFED